MSEELSKSCDGCATDGRIREIFYLNLQTHAGTGITINEVSSTHLVETRAHLEKIPGPLIFFDVPQITKV